ncbi:MAG: polysaccharide biosynthesis protein, partial [Thermosynechococcaceae cyanobacterium]
LYDHRYAQAAWMLPILALGNWPRMLPMTIAPVLLAAGKPIYGSIGNCLKFVYMLVALPLAFSLFGPLGAIIVVAFNDIPFYVVISFGLWREGFSSLKQDFMSTGWLILGITGAIALRYYLGFGLPIDSLWLQGFL